MGDWSYIDEDAEFDEDSGTDVSSSYLRAKGSYNAVIKENMMYDNTFTCMPIMFTHPLLGKFIYDLNIAL